MDREKSIQIVLEWVEPPEVEDPKNYGLWIAQDNGLGRREGFNGTLFSNAIIQLLCLRCF